MGNKLSCSCAPLIRKAYRYEDSPWQTTRRRDGHLLRLWAEVFHVSAASGAVKWQQVSEDLVPVNITCVQDNPECVFHITAYNSQVEKILDVRLVQPGTRLGQASECFVYWKDPSSGDTWGLNFTSPIDAKQFRECCSPTFKFSRKASSSYSLKLEPPKHQQNQQGGGQQKVKGKRKPQSTPSSPSRGVGGRELQCTCMTAETLHRTRNGRVRYTGAATLPRAGTQVTGGRGGAGGEGLGRLSAHPSSQSVYDNVSLRKAQSKPLSQQQSGDRTSSKTPSQASSQQQTPSQPTSGSDQTPSSQQQQQQQHQQHQQQQQQTRAQLYAQSARKEQAKSMDYSTMSKSNTHAKQGHHQHHQQQQQQHNLQQPLQSSRSKSSDNVFEQSLLQSETVGGLSLDSNTLKRMLHPLPSAHSSPEQEHRSHHGRRILQQQDSGGERGRTLQAMAAGSQSLGGIRSRLNRSEVGRRRSLERTLCLDLADSEPAPSGSPPSDHFLYDNLCYATTPSSSNDNSDVPYVSSDEGGGSRQHHQKGHRQRGGGTGGGGGSTAMVSRSGSTTAAPGTGSPTSKLLVEYEMHLRNALARGLDAESYSLHTFEALLSQSMENVVALMREVHVELEAIKREEKALQRPSDLQQYQQYQQYQQQYHHNQQASAMAAMIMQAAASARPSSHNQGQGHLSLWGNSGPAAPPVVRCHTLPHASSLRGASTGGSQPSLHQPPGHQLLQPALHLMSGSLEHSFGQQASIDSTDSRIYLTSSEMSDDDRLSLTTAVSDEEDGESRNSPYRSRSGAAAASFNCTGAVRKAGFLSVKKWLLRKHRQVELARKRGWKGYWVCLKGTTLLFYPCDSRDGRAIDATPKHLIIVDGAIMQPIPEHPKRDYIFCLSTAFGDAYLFQAPCQVELENWIHSIHSACAAAFARHRGKTGTLHLLQEEIFRLEKEIESDFKLKHMAELQLTVVADVDSKQSLTHQINEWEENLERLHCEQFRLRCYMASLQNAELPNPKSLLAHVSKATKNTLNKLGVFTVSSFHAYVCARSPSLLTNLLSGRGATKRRSKLSRSNSCSNNCLTSTRRRPLNLSTSSMQSMEIMPGDKQLHILLPENQSVVVGVRDTMTVEEVLWCACARKQLSPHDHFLRARRKNDECFVPPRTETLENMNFENLEVLAKVLYQTELGRSTLEHLFGFSVEAELVENSDHQDELCVYVSRVEEGSLAHRQGLIKGDEIMVINGAIVSDLDMMYIESVLQEELSLCMMMRSARSEPPDPSSGGGILGGGGGLGPNCAGLLRSRSTDDYIESLVCPPPPSDNTLSDEMIGRLIVPSPLWGSVDKSPEASGLSSPQPPAGAQAADLYGGLSGEQIDALLKVIEDSCRKTAEQVTEYCRVPLERRRSSLQGGPGGSGSGSGAAAPIHPGAVAAAAAAVAAERAAAAITATGTATGSAAGTGSGAQTGPGSNSGTPFTPGRQLTDGEKLRKVIMELLETERTYVKHLNNLLEHYLEPMKKETFLSNAEINSLFGNIQEIVQFQRVFLQSLEEAVAAEPDFNAFDQPTQFKNVLFALGNSFLYYADQFKLYSSFCASHSKAQKVLHPTNADRKERPTATHAATDSTAPRSRQKILKESSCMAGEGNAALAEFLQSRNPKGQHSFSLESYLIKPIQRILKYPLLLQQLKHLTDPNTQEHQHLAEALKGMERVAEHINEMQRIHEEYGAIFDHLYRQQLKSSKQHVDLSPGELLYYGGVEWINISEFLGKIKKGLELHAMCFVFKTAVVFLCKERIRQKKKLMGGSSKNNTSEVEIIRYQVLIPVTEVQVRASSLKDADMHFLWELIHLKSQIQRRSEKVYQLSNSTSEFRNAFLRTIRQIIRESVRNMTVPANRPPAGRDKLLAAAAAAAKKGAPYEAAAVAAAGVARTLSSKKAKSGKATPQRHSAGNIDGGGEYSVETYDNVDNFRTRSRTVADGMGDMGGSSKELHLMQGGASSSESRGQSPTGAADSERSDRSDKSDKSDKSEKSARSDKGSVKSEQVIHHHTLEKPIVQSHSHHGVKPNLGTPKALSLSTTSTLSSSSTGSSSAKLIQSSHPPGSFPGSGTLQASTAPVGAQSLADNAGSPVWKPRDSSGERPASAASGRSEGREQHFVYDEYGGSVYVTPSSAQQRNMSSKQSDC